MELFKVIFFTLACAANILIVANSIGLPMRTSVHVIRSSPILVFAFLFCYALTATPEIAPALLGTIIYFVIESEALMELFYLNEKGTYNPYLNYANKLKKSSLEEI